MSDSPIPSVSAPDAKRMDPQEFMNLGYLQEVNRLVLHPAGLALYIEQDEKGEWLYGGVFDWREDPEGVVFSEAPDPDKRAQVREEWVKHKEAREAMFGPDLGDPTWPGRVQHIFEIPE